MGFSANVQVSVSWVLEADGADKVWKSSFIFSQINFLCNFVNPIRFGLTSADVNGGWELDESNISVQSIGVPVGMDVFLSCADLETVWLGDANIVSSQVDIKVCGTRSHEANYFRGNLIYVILQKDL